MGPTNLALFTRSSPDRDRANITYNVLPYSRKVGAMRPEFHDHPGITMSVYDLRPTSIGRVRLKDANPQSNRS